MFGAISTTSSTTTAAQPQFPRQPFTNNFNFGSSTSQPLFGGLTQPQAAAAAVDAAEGGDAAAANDDDSKPYEPPKAEIVDVSEPDAAISVKCKLFYFDGMSKKWESRGIGMAHVKKLPTDTTNSDARHCQLIVRLSNSLGTVLLNVRLNVDENQVQFDQKKPVNPQKPVTELEFRSVSMPPIDEKQPEKLFKFMMRVRSAADRDKFIDTVRSLTM